MDLNTVLSRNPEAAFRLYEGQATVVLPTESKVHVINEFGSTLWERIDGVKTLGRILEEILNEYDIDRARAEADLFEFAASLRAEGMVR
jgi:hypothetical protein